MATLEKRKSSNTSHSVDLHSVYSEFFKMYSFKWTLKDFLKLPLNMNIMSPDLKPSPLHKWNLALIRNEQDELNLKLINKSDKPFKLGCNISILDRNYEIWQQEIQPWISCPHEPKTMFSLDFPIVISMLSQEILTCLFVFNITDFVEQIDSESDKCPLQALSSGLIKHMIPSNAAVTLNVDGQNILTEKSVLREKSPVFAEMLQDKMDQEHCYIEINDIDFVAIQKLIEYFYSSWIDVSEIESTSALYSAAIKYDVWDVKMLLADSLLTKLTAGNAIKVLLCADRRRIEDLKDEVKNFIRKNFAAVVDTKIWRVFASSGTKLAAETIKYCSTGSTCKD